MKATLILKPNLTAILCAGLFVFASSEAAAGSRA